MSIQNDSFLKLNPGSFCKGLLINSTKRKRLAASPVQIWLVPYRTTVFYTMYTLQYQTSNSLAAKDFLEMICPQNQIKACSHSAACWNTFYFQPYYRSYLNIGPVCKWIPQRAFPDLPVLSCLRHSLTVAGWGRGANRATLSPLAIHLLVQFCLTSLSPRLPRVWLDIVPVSLLRGSAWGRPSLCALPDWHWRFYSGDHNTWPLHDPLQDAVLFGRTSVICETFAYPNPFRMSIRQLQRKELAVNTCTVDWWSLCCWFCNE